jgi:hypothetical protein
MGIERKKEKDRKKERERQRDEHVLSARMTNFHQKGLTG